MSIYEHSLAESIHRELHMCISEDQCPTRALDEGPLEALVFGAEGRLQHHVLAVGERETLLALGLVELGRAPHGPAVRALHALATARVAGVTAPSALRLLQALTARPQPRTVLSCGCQRERERERERESVCLGV